MDKRSRLQHILTNLAKKTLKKYSPTIIGVTGSVGKTTTKEAIRIGLKDHMVLRASAKSQNNEVGIPLTIIGADAGSGWVSWGMVILKAWWQTVWTNDTYPEVLILEIGIDRPGDMKAICDWIPFTIGIVTSIGSSHIEFFKDRKTLANEKLRLLKSLPKEGAAIVNKDDETIMENLPKLKATLRTYGFDQDANVSADPNITNARIPETPGDSYSGIGFKFNTEGKHVPIHLPNIISRHHIYAALAAITVGQFLKAPLLDIAQSLESMQAAPGRMRLLPGIHGSWIIDDSYNASSPEAPIAALYSLESLEGVKGRRIAVLGDMLELGEYTMEAHQKVADVAKEVADIVVAVGERGRIIAEKLERTGYPKEHLLQFDRSRDDQVESRDPGKVLRDMVQEGDVVLVKGSQGVRMEYIVEHLLAPEVDPKDVLARQDKNWKRH